MFKQIINKKHFTLKIADLLYNKYNNSLKKIHKLN